jgi:predicted amidohydrolase YtcJ
VLPGGIDAHVHLVYAALAAELTSRCTIGARPCGPGGLARL